MTDPQEKDGAKIVHESVAQTETCEPDPICPDTRSIDEIKEVIFSATPCSKTNVQNLMVESENHATGQSTSQQSEVPNSSVRSLGFTFPFPVENDEFGSPQCTNSDPAPPPEKRGLSRTSSRSSGYAGSEHCITENVDLHDPRAFFQRTSSESLNSSLSREAMREIYDRALRSETCQTCGLLKDTCPSKETMELWDRIEWSGSDDRKNCHCKFWSLFLKSLKETFPAEDGLNNKQVVHLLKTMLEVNEAEDGEISCSNLVKVVRFFGPMKKDDQNKCILIQHLVDIVKRSLVKGTIKGKSVKQSWFAGNMTREQAEERLKDEKDNTYLVRMSQSGSEEGNFVVSVKDKNGIHHFEIEGNPAESCKSPNLNCHLKFNGNEYDSLASVIEDLKYNSIKDDEEEGCDVQCTFICPNLPFNSIIAPYKNINRR